MQIGFFEKQVLRWRLAGRRLIRECFGGPEGREAGKQDGAKGDAGLHAIQSLQRLQPILLHGLKLGWPLRVVLKRREGAGVACTDPLSEGGFSLPEGSVAWDEPVLSS